MSFFSSIGNAVSGVVNKVVKPVIKDAIPIAAAVATGGTSLAYLKPTNSLARLDKITGLPVTQISNMASPTGFLSAGGGQSEAPVSQVVQETASPPYAPAQGASIYDQITPYLNSFLQASQTKSSEVAPNANILAAQPIQQSAPRSNVLLYVIGGIVVLLGGFLLIRKK